MAHKLLPFATWASLAWHAGAMLLATNPTQPQLDQIVAGSMEEFARIDVAGEIRVTQLVGLSFPDGTDPHNAPRDSAFGIHLERPSEVRWEMKYSMDGSGYWLTLLSSSSKPEFRGDDDDPLSILGHVGGTSYHYYREGKTAYVSSDPRASVPWLIGVARLDGIFGPDLSADRWFESRLGLRKADVSGASSHTYNGVSRMLPGLGIPIIQVSIATINERSAHRIRFAERRMLIHRLSDETAVPLVVEMRRAEQLRQRVVYQWRQSPHARLGVAPEAIHAQQFHDFTRNLGPEVAANQTTFLFNPDATRVGAAAGGVNPIFPAGTAVEQRANVTTPVVRFDPVQVVKERKSLNLFFAFMAMALFGITTLLGFRRFTRRRQEVL